MTRPTALSKRKRQPWGGPRAASLVLFVLLVASLVSSWHTPPNSFPDAMRLDSGLVFHGAFAAIVFLALYFLASLITYTVIQGGPVGKLGFGNLTFDGTAGEALAEAGVGLQGQQEQLDALTTRGELMLAVLRDTQQALIELVDGVSSTPQKIKDEALRRIEQLDRLEASTDGTARRKTREAIARFRAKFAELEEVYGKMGNNHDE